MLRIRAHSARLVGLSDGLRDGSQNVLLYFMPRDCDEPCALALSLEDAGQLQAGLALMLPEIAQRQRDLTEAN